MTEIKVEYEWIDANAAETGAAPPPEQAGPRGTAAAGRAFFSALRADLAAYFRRIGRPFSSSRRRRPAIASATRPRSSATARVLRGFLIGVAGLVGIAVVGVAGLMLWALRDLPLDRDEAGADAQPAILLEAADGEPLGRIGRFKIADAQLTDYSDVVIDAVLSIEDRRFYSHFGVDPLGVARAARRNFTAGAVVEGGSTITQQLVKMIALDDERTLTRKLREAAMAIWLERRLSKDEILTRYLNTIYLGSSAYGMPAAAKLYFDKSVSDVTLPEAALLAGLIKAPSDYTPLKNLGRARERAAIVLDAMTANGVITEEEAEQARTHPATLNRARSGATAGTWFADWAAEEASAIAGSFNENIRVRTTLVPEMQRLAEEVVGASLDSSGEEEGFSQAALVAMRADGAVLAMVGGRDYQESQFNRAVQAQRQPGSAFKLFVYLAALRNGFNPGDVVEDAPIDVDGWRPENFGGEYRGRVTLAEAFARSINTVAVRLALDVGLDQVISAARDLGIDAALSETPSLALGAVEVNLLDLTGAYASVLHGSKIEPWGIAALGPDSKPQLYSIGSQLETGAPPLSHQDQLITLLQLAVEQGTGTHAKLDGFAAGKTGTSQNHRDAWFIGFSEALVVGVWVGNDDGTPMRKVTGGAVPARIWQSFMTNAMTLVGDRPPATVVGVEQDLLVEQEQPAGQETRVERPWAWMFQRFSPEEPGDLRCDYQACAQEYRSFRASDCTYQPFSGGRRLCEITTGNAESPLLVERPLGQAEPLDPQEAAVQPPQPEAPTEPPLLSLQEATAAPAAAEAAPEWCDVSACAAAYASFSASDCTFQPYGDGPRQLCDKVLGEAGGLPVPLAAEPALQTAEPPAPAVDASLAPPVPAGALQCDVAVCAATFPSFSPSDCTYQPAGGGPREICVTVPIPPSAIPVAEPLPELIQ